MIRLVLPAILLVGVAPAFGAQRDQDRIIAEIRQIQTQLADLIEAQGTLAEEITGLRAELDQELEANRRARAESSNTISRLDRNVDVIRESISQNNQRLSDLMAEVEELRELRSAALLPVETPGTEEEATAGPDPAAEDEDAAPEAEVLEGPGVSDLFLEARADYLQGRYALAVSGFEHVIEIGGELADNAVYFLGESMLAEERLEDALSQFETLIEDFPDSDQVPDAWYKKGYILERLGNQEDAREIYEDILEVFAGTPAALAAERQLAGLPASEPGC